MKPLILILMLAGLAAGCASGAKERAAEQRAYLAGQNAALQRMPAQPPGITVVGPVQNPNVPWVAGLTLAQALATANYLSPGQPSEIILSRSGLDQVIDPNDLDRMAQIILESGDVVTLRQ